MILTVSTVFSATEPLANWKMDAVTDGKLTDTTGKLTIPATGVKIVEDERLGSVVQFESNDGLVIPKSIVEKLGDTLSISMWLKPLKKANDATWQPMLNVRNNGDWKKDLIINLRWNRFIIKAGNRKDFDTKQIVESDWWSHIVLTRTADAAEVFINGKSLGKNMIEGLSAGFTGDIIVGCGAYAGDMAFLRIYDRVLTDEDMQAIIKEETPPDLPGENEPAPNIAGETLGVVKKRTRYTIKDLKENFPPIEEWKSLGVELDPYKLSDSYAEDRFKKPPKPYVHPRVYFNEEDLPEIRKKLKESHIARMQMEYIRGRLLQISSKEAGWESVPYKPTEEDHKRFLEKGMRIDNRSGFRGPWVGGWMNELAAGKCPVDLEGTWDKNPTESKRQYLMHLLPFEAFRCLIDDDKEGGERVAAALTTIVREFSKHMDKWTGTDNWQQIYWALSSDSVGLSYDWAYKFMSDAQRKEIRTFIAAVTKGKTFLGLDQVPAVPGNTSNWIIIHMNLMPLVLSIEGEEGFDEMVYKRCLEGMRKWVYVASGPQGAPFEGLTKSMYAPHWLLPPAKRGDAFIGSEWAKNHVRRYHLGIMLPWAEECVFETTISSPREKDVGAFKYAHPNDPVVDLIYAYSVRDLLSPDAKSEWVNIRTTYAPWWPYLIMNDDPIGFKVGHYDLAKRRDEVLADLQKMEPLTYFSDFRGVMTTRTSWDKNALFLYFEPRNVPGGHTRDGRNEFVLASHGRVWASRTTAVEDSSEFHSVILIDGKGQGHQCPQGRTVAMQDNNEATFCVGDAKWAYGHAAGSDDDKPVMATPNESRLKPSPLPWMDKPWNFMPAWDTGMKGGGRHGHWKEYNPVQYAFRSVGLVRGEHPYVVVVDDLKKDDKPHKYDWHMQVSDDVELLSSGLGKDGAFDMILGDKQGRRLLLRVVAAGDSKGVPNDLVKNAKLESYERVDRGNTTVYHRVVLPMTSVKASYKIILFPYRDGEELPDTSTSGDTLTVKWKGQKDKIQLTNGTDGRSRLTVKRGFKKLVEIK